MALPSPPIAYYPLGTSAWNGQYLAENNAIGDYVFDFDTSRIQVSNQSLGITSQIAISAWVKIPDGSTGGAAPNIQQIVSEDTTSGTSRNWILSWRGGGYEDFYFAVFHSDGTSTSTYSNVGDINDGNWHHVVGTWDGTTNANAFKIYVDNVATSTTSTKTDIRATSNIPTTIGAIPNAFTRAFDGNISNVQIWDKNLSSTEAETLYNYGSPIRTLANIPQSSNLKAWYKLDASEVYNNTTTEWSIDNNQNPSAYASSLNFNGSSDYIDCGTGSRFNINQITISAWVNLSSGLTSTQIIAGIRNNTSGGGSICYQLQNQASGKFRFVIRQSNGTYVDSVANDVHQYNTWYHVLGVADGSNIKLYVNGNLQTIVSSYDGTIYSPNENFNIGKQSSPSNYYWDGKLSNVSVFNTGLTSAQVEELYNNGTPSNLSNHSATSNLVSWWKLNNTTTGIEDAKGSNNGTNYGATEYAGFVNKLVGDSSGMTQANLVQSDLQTVAPYSKYAMDFDGTDYIDYGDSDDFSFNGAGNADNPFSISAWINMDDATRFRIANKYNGTNQNEYIFTTSGSDLLSLNLYDNSSGGYIGRKYNTALTSYQGQWIHVVCTYDATRVSSGIKLYLNGTRVDDTDNNSGSYTKMRNTSQPFLIAQQASTYANGKISNISIWNAALTSAQVSELYNQGLPSNLNSHSAYSNLISWWQLGENSSFDGNDWIVADEKGTNNGTSTGMPVGALVNGVGTTANGLSSGMSEGNLVGDAPYSTANAISTNMVVTSRVSGSGNTP